MTLSGIYLDGEHLLDCELDKLPRREYDRAIGQMRSGIDETLRRKDRAVIFSAPSLLEKFTAAVVRPLMPAEPNRMQTAIFEEDVAIPYLETLFRRSRGGYTEIFNPPRKTEKTLNTKRYSWHEADKVEDEIGSYYEIHAVEKISPALNSEEEITRTRLGLTDGLPERMDKTIASRMLQALEHVEAASPGKKPYRDAKPFRHFSHYVSEQGRDNFPA